MSAGTKHETTRSTGRLLGRQGRVVTREIAGETLLVPIRTDVHEMHHIFALNPVAAHVWAALDGTTSVDQLVMSICETFDVGSDRARQDLALFLEQLFEAGLVAERS